MENSIVIQDLSKKYSDFSLNHINLKLPKGCIMGLVGENGAGKTTMIKLILNLINRDDGEIKLFDRDSLKYDKLNKEDIGVVLDGSFFSEYLSVKDIGRIMKQFYKTFDDELFSKYMREFNLPTTKIFKDFSTGMKMKLQIAAALSHHPKLLILDEPTSGLDPIVRNEILDIFLEFIQDEERSILLSTHITSDLENIADFITFINDGSIILSESRDVLMDQYGILKCTDKQFNKIDPVDIVSYKKNRYDYEILVSDRSNCRKKYSDMLVDKVTIENMMLLYIKGERK